MSREGDVAARMIADTQLMLTLTGGVYTSATAGPDGITRETNEAAFESSGNGPLKPCALVVERGDIPDGIVADEIAQDVSTFQVVEIWFYEQAGSYTQIDLARARTFQLFYGYQFADTFPLKLINRLARQKALGALGNNSMERQDWQINSVIGA